MATLGSVLDRRYQLTRLIGQGGMGAVYEALNTRTHRRVAIKLLLPAFCSDAKVVARLWREAQAASQIRHPHIVDVLDLGVDETNGEHFIVQELLEGRSFEAILEERLPSALSPEEALEIVVPVMGALVACHRQGIVHRDIKPANVFVVTAADGRSVPKVIDFGISKVSDASARQTATGMVLGTPMYMAPEQARGDADVDARADVWSVGVMLYEALSGRFPYEGSNANVVIAKILTSRPVPFSQVAVGVPPALVAAIERAVEPDRELRWRSMQAFVAALLECDLSPSVRATLQDAVPPSLVPTAPEPLQHSSIAARSQPATHDTLNVSFIGGTTRRQVSLRVAAVLLVILAATGVGIMIGGGRAAANRDGAPHAPATVWTQEAAAPPTAMVNPPAAEPTRPSIPPLPTTVPLTTAPSGHSRGIASANAAHGQRPTSPRPSQPTAHPSRNHSAGAEPDDPLAPSDPYARGHAP